MSQDAPQTASEPVQEATGAPRRVRRDRPQAAGRAPRVGVDFARGDGPLRPAPRRRPPSRTGARPAPAPPAPPGLRRLAGRSRPARASPGPGEPPPGRGQAGRSRRRPATRGSSPPRRSRPRWCARPAPTSPRRSAGPRWSRPSASSSIPSCGSSPTRGAARRCARSAARSSRGSRPGSWSTTSAASTTLAARRRARQLEALQRLLLRPRQGARTGQRTAPARPAAT